MADVLADITSSSKVPELMLDALDMGLYLQQNSFALLAFRFCFGLAYSGSSHVDVSIRFELFERICCVICDTICGRVDL